jgi:hypothetical protein
MPNVFLSSPRFIGQIIPDITIEEIAASPALVTKHPYELGTEISDHMVLRNKVVTMRVAWSDSTHATDGFVRLVWQALLALQATREPFDVSTGKKLYPNMVIESIIETTDEKSEFILSVIATLSEVLITFTDFAAIPGDPAQSGAVTTGGIRQLQDRGPGSNLAPQYSQFGGLSNNTVPSVGSIPGIGFPGLVE